MKPQSEAVAAIEVLRPGEIERRRERTDLEILDTMVKQRVAEILSSRDELIFEPFFRARQVAYEIKRLQTVPERKKWSVYFERHGCLACQRKDRPHASNGLCTPCHGRVTQRLKAIIEEILQDRPNGSF